MFMSRQLEKSQKTKFKKSRQEEVLERKTKQKKNESTLPSDRNERGFDMWGDIDDGC